MKARERFVRKVTTWVKANRHQPVRAQQAHLTKMLNGYYQYFGLYFCTDTLSGVLRRVREVWQRALQRRSQKAKRRYRLGDAGRQTVVPTSDSHD